MSNEIRVSWKTFPVCGPTQRVQDCTCECPRSQAGYMVRSMRLIPTNKVGQACGRISLVRLPREACLIRSNGKVEKDTVTLMMSRVKSLPWREEMTPNTSLRFVMSAVRSLFVQRICTVHDKSYKSVSPRCISMKFVLHARTDSLVLPSVPLVFSLMTTHSRWLKPSDSSAVLS